MAGIDQILYVVLVGGAVYLAYSTGLLDQAGQAIVSATAPKSQGFAKHHRQRREEILIEPYPLVKPPMRLTMA